MNGNLIVLEGIDGCGKSTQIDYLSKWLPISGLMPSGSKLQITREPGGTNLGKSLRKLLLNIDTNDCPEPLSELLLYAADRAQHVSQLILPAIEKGDWVLSDRFSGSTIAYQGYGRQLDLEIIYQLEEIATQGLTPDITLWLDITIEESLARRKALAKDRIESEGKIFLERVSSGFAKLTAERNWIKVAASDPSETVSTKIKEVLIKRFH